MVERPNYFEMTPVQLNEELRALYGQMPIDVIPEDLTDKPLAERLTEIHQSAEAHRRSEHKKIVIDTLQRLKPHFKVSPYFSNFIVQVFNRNYDSGIDKENAGGEAEFFEVLLDFEIEGSEGGIFDLMRAKYIEYRLFEQAVIDTVYARRDLREAESDMVFDTEEDKEVKIPKNRLSDRGVSIFDLDFPLGEDLQEWLVSYMKHYPTSKELLQ